jgi:hypothetical protein
MPNKSTPSSKIKVSQATIDKIKKMGMTAALKSAPGANAEMAEGLRRMYGARRVEAAKLKARADSTFKGPRNQGKAGLTPGMGRSSSTSKPKGSSKKNNNLGLKIAGGAAAAGLLIASRGKAVGAASKLAPALAKSGLAKKLLGTGETFIKNPVVTKATAGIKAGSKQPKVPGTRMEYAAKMAQDKARQELAALAKKKTAASAAATKKVGKK